MSNIFSNQEEMQIKSKTGYHFILIRLATCNRLKKFICARDLKKKKKKKVYVYLPCQKYEPLHNFVKAT